MYSAFMKKNQEQEDKPDDPNGDAINFESNKNIFNKKINTNFDQEYFIFPYEEIEKEFDDQNRLNKLNEIETEKILENIIPNNENVSMQPLNSQINTTSLDYTIEQNFKNLKTPEEFREALYRVITGQKGKKASKDLIYYIHERVCELTSDPYLKVYIKGMKRKITRYSDYYFEFYAPYANQIIHYIENFKKNGIINYEILNRYIIQKRKNKNLKSADEIKPQ